MKKILNLKNFLENKEINDKTTSFELRKKLNLTNDETASIKKILDSLRDYSVIPLLIDLTMENQRNQVNQANNNSLVWTSPFVFHKNAENTETTIFEMINSAKKSIQIVGYTIEPDTGEIFAELEKKSKTGVAVNLYFDNAENFLPLIQKMWKHKGTLPEVYSFKSKNSKKSSLHAKVIIIDEEELLITSANLTGRGISRNVEIGMRHRGNSAKKAAKLVKTLVDNEYLVKI